MNIKDIDKEISTLENSVYSLSNVRNLSALYNVREHLSNAIQSKPDALQRELDDILPQYRLYCDIKRQYQLGKTSEEDVIRAMRNVCKEIYEFLLLLYQNTDMSIERKQLKSMLNDLQDAL